MGDFRFLSFHQTKSVSKFKEMKKNLNREPSYWIIALWILDWWRNSMNNAIDSDNECWYSILWNFTKEWKLIVGTVPEDKFQYIKCIVDFYCTIKQSKFTLLSLFRWYIDQFLLWENSRKNLEFVICCILRSKSMIKFKYSFNSQLLLNFRLMIKNVR